MERMEKASFKMNLIKQLRAAFEENRHSEIAKKQRAYLKNLFPFLGLKKPLRTSLQITIFSKNKIERLEELTSIVKKLWSLDKREYHYAAIDLLKKYKKLLSFESFELLEMLIRKNSWWDSVDLLAANILGHLLLKFPSLKNNMDSWITDKDLWIRRSAILFQLKYRQKTDEEKLFSYCEKRMHEKEFFIRKAIGWVLREYSKTDPEKVLKFLRKNKNSLSPLSLREASKYLKANKL